MAYLLNLVYLSLIAVLFPYFLYASIRYGKYREGFRAKFFGRVPTREQNGPCIWLHAVSVGEVILLRPLLARIEQEHPDWTCVISTTSLTGYALAKRKFSPLSVFYCPFDFTWAVKSALRRIRPDMLVLAELELWPNLIRFARQAGVKIAVMNGRLSERSARRYGYVRPLVRPMFEQLDLVAAQTEEYAARFRALGARPEVVHVTGSLKFEGAETDRRNHVTEHLRQLAGIAPDDVVFLAGSTQSPEETMALNVFRILSTEHPKLRLILVPRHADRFREVETLLEQAGVPWQKRSQLDSTGPSPGTRVLLVDVIGELAAWWGTATVGYVGGSMGSRGGQNMIEPSAYGVAVSFGPRTENFKDVVTLLLSRDAAVVVNDERALTDFVSRCLTDPAYAPDLGRRARQLVAEQLGATGRTMSLLNDLYSQPRPAADSRRVDQTHALPATTPHTSLLRRLAWWRSRT